MLLEEQTNTGTCASLLEKQLCALSIQNPLNCFELKTVTGTIIEKKRTAIALRMEILKVLAGLINLETFL